LAFAKANEVHDFGYFNNLVAFWYFKDLFLLAIDIDFVHHLLVFDVDCTSSFFFMFFFDELQCIKQVFQHDETSRIFQASHQGSGMC
jgi:hypothetical protein